MTDDIEQAVRVPTVIDDDHDDFTVIATNPAQMERSQKSLILWVARKLQAEKELEADTLEQHDIAVKNKWKTDAWKRRLKNCGERLIFYRKVKAALEAGYYIVPPFPMDAFAVRTKTETPLYYSGATKSMVRLRPEALPETEGHYVNVHPNLRQHNVYAQDPVTHITNYSKITSRWYSTFSHASVDFPFKLVKPIVMEETAKAMALKIFDQLGVIPAVHAQGAVVSTNADPMICGQILAKHKKLAPLTFFIAWWLDTRSI